MADELDNTDPFTEKRRTWVAMAEDDTRTAADAPAEPDEKARHRAAVLAPLAHLRRAGGPNHLIANAIEAVVHALFAGPPPEAEKPSDEQLASERADSIDPKTGLLLAAGTEHPDVTQPPISEAIVKAHQVMPMAEARQTGPAVVVGVEGHITDENLAVDKNIGGEQPEPGKGTGNTVAGTPGPVPTQSAQPTPPGTAKPWPAAEPVKPVPAV